MQKELVMYSRTTGCPFVSLAKRVLDEHEVAYREIYIDKDETARERVRDWTGYLSVPTLIIATPGEDLPAGDVADIDKSKSPRGIDRGAMITEPNIQQLIAWLGKHAFITVEEEGEAAS